MNGIEQALVREALSYYHLTNPEVSFIRHSENLTCRIVDGQQAFALRIHSPTEGFSLKIFGNQATACQLMRGETELLLHLHNKATFPVQVPWLTISGDSFCVLADGSPACLLHWINGTVLQAEDGGPYASALGDLAARIHQAAEGFSGTRLSYSHDLVQAMQHELALAGQAKHLTVRQAALCRSALDEVDAVMTALDRVPQAKGLIHADLGFSNILHTPDGLAPIDFSLAGYGYKVQECGMLASNYGSSEQRKAVCDGYTATSGTQIDPHHIDVFLAVSILLFIASQHERYHQEEWFGQAMDRWCDTCFAGLNERECLRMPPEKTVAKDSPD